MKQLPTKTVFDHNHLCWKCEDATNKGSLDYCEKCEEAHFICIRCSHEYFKEQEKIYPEDSQFSVKQRRNMK